MQFNRSLLWRWAVAALAAALLGVGCSGDGKNDQDVVGSVQQGLVRCQDCDDVLAWVRLVTLEAVSREAAANLAQTLEYWDGGWWDGDVPDDGGWWDDDSDWGDDDEATSDDDASDDDAYGGDDDQAADDDSENDAGDDEDHSDTNTQEGDVDEADIVKTDGAYLYLLAGGELIIIDPNPGELTHELTRYDVEGKTLEMFLHGNNVVVFSRTHPASLAEDVFAGVDRDTLSSDILVVTILDISDTVVPREIRKVYIEGGYLSSRRIGDVVRLVVSSYPRGPEVETWVDPWSFAEGGELDTEGLIAAYDALGEANAQAVNEAPLDAWLPRYFDVHGSERQMGFLSNCEDYFHPLDPMGRAVSTVMTIDLTQPLEKLPDVGLLADGSLIYASSSSLFIAGAADTYYEWGGEELQRSLIHKFSLGGGEDQAIYTGSGEIEGFVLNQFSMSESDDGYLRVASSSGWWESLDNHVFVLEQRDGELGVIGHIDGIAPGEEIRSARFMGDRGYMVTFEQTDPLFTISVSNPANPILVGELQIPGFSTYIHPFGANHILTIGQDGDEWGSTGGVILQIFDLTDFAHPELTFKEVVVEGWDASSAALYDHKAFLYYAPEDLLAIPTIDYNWDSWGDDDWWDGEDDWGDEGGDDEPEVPPTDDDSADDDDTVDDDDSWTDDDDVSGAVSGVKVYRVNAANGFSPLGFIDHSGYEPEAGDDPLYDVPQARRSVVIGDYLYTISDAALVVTRIDSFEDVVVEDLPYENPWDDYWDGGWGDDDWVDGGGGEDTWVDSEG